LNVVEAAHRTTRSAVTAAARHSYVKKSDVFGDATPCHVPLVRTDVSEGCIFTTIRVKRINKLGTTLAVTSN
jgi:hypothetical protein